MNKSSSTGWKPLPTRSTWHSSDKAPAHGTSLVASKVYRVDVNICAYIHVYMYVSICMYIHRYILYIHINICTYVYSFIKIRIQDKP